MVIMTEKAIARKLQGQVAIVTGGGRGIGAATATLLARAGAAVVVTARGEEEIEAVAAQIRGSGGKAVAAAGDVSDVEQVEEIVETALTQYDRVDILVNNAGTIWPIEEAAAADPDEWAYNIHVNLVGPYIVARNVLPVMMAQGYGRILNITSGAANHVIPGWSAYCSAKAGLNMMTRALATELAGTGVSVNALSPGMVDTEMQADVRSVDVEGTGLDYSRFHEAYKQGTLRSPAETARLIYWIVGPWGHTYNGEIFEASNAAWTAQVEKDIP
jgi:NAD(P)-dependent dehydrogenase (short-subunit alcohol dehydrogenase family)